MKRSLSTKTLHLAYWIVVILTLTIVFGRKWQNNFSALYFITMLVPVVLGTSYFINYYLIPKYVLPKKYGCFILYLGYTLILSLELEMVILAKSYISLGMFSFAPLAPNASDVLLLAYVLYLLVFIGCGIPLIQSLRSNQYSPIVTATLPEFLQIVSNRKLVSIPFHEITFIESLTSLVKIHTAKETHTTNQKISHLEKQLSDPFLRIHRSFIVNTHTVESFTSSEIMVGSSRLPIGRTYREKVKGHLLKGRRDSLFEY